MLKEREEVPELIGKTIVSAVLVNEKALELTLDDGNTITFEAGETEEYGGDMCLHQTA